MCLPHEKSGQWTFGKLIPFLRPNNASFVLWLHPLALSRDGSKLGNLEWIPDKDLGLLAYSMSCLSLCKCCVSLLGVWMQALWERPHLGPPNFVWYRLLSAYGELAGKSISCWGLNISWNYNWQIAVPLATLEDGLYGTDNWFLLETLQTSVVVTVPD